jgi:hypothetical protein
MTNVCNVYNSGPHFVDPHRPLRHPRRRGAEPHHARLAQPYGSGSSTQWCFPKNSTSYPDYNTVLCDGATTIGWISLVKTGGVYGNGIYNGDSFAIQNSRNTKFCSVNGSGLLSCNTDDTSFASIFTIMFV